MRRSEFLCAMAIAVIILILSLPNGAKAKEDVRDEPKNDIPKLFAPRARPTENFPCSKCHSYRAMDRSKRKLVEYHTGIELKHAEEQRWCYDCHDGDKLRLQNGQLVPFDKSYYLCGQCHGTIFRDWKAGVHGKRTGAWNGEKLYRLCVSCHDPHQPKFKPLEPKQPPMKSEDIK